MRISPLAGLRLGLCCQFVNEAVKFHTTTATATLRLSPEEQHQRLATLCQANADALLAALKCCVRQGIGSFRINSQILPLKTHPDAGYELPELPGGEAIAKPW